MSMNRLFYICISLLLISCQLSRNDELAESDENRAKLVSIANLPCYQVKYQLGTNVHCMCESHSVNTGGLLGSAYSGIPYPQDIESWHKIFKHLSWFGFNWIRLGFEHNDIQYEREDTYGKILMISRRRHATTRICFSF